MNATDTRPTPTTSAAEAAADPRIRRRLLQAAVERLAARGGLAEGLLDEAAAAVGCPPERARLYFGGDAELVLALYLRLADALAARVADLPDGPLAERFGAAVSIKLGLIAPWREALLAIAPRAFDRAGELGVLAPATELVRGRVQAAFEVVVAGATDVPDPADRAALARSLYAAHLLVVLAACIAGEPAARGLLAGIRDRLAAGRSPARIEAVASIDRALARLAGPRGVRPEPEATARAVLRVLFEERRLLPGASAEACGRRACERCLAPHLPAVRHFVRRGLPVELVLPAFPAKSPNPTKVLGALPDRAERIALDHLQRVCDRIAAVHPPGARITICSDGHVFGDLVGVRDEDVTAYGARIAELVAARPALRLFGMEDLYGQGDLDRMRERLCADYAEPLEAIVARADAAPRHRALFSGIHRFLFEDRVGLEPEKSRNRVRRECKERAHRVIRRSDAWGRLVADCFPAALRLSIHPQHPHAEKIGIRLGRCTDVWLTPWHGVALRDRDGRYRFVKRREAEALGARLVVREGRPSHFTLQEEPACP